MGEAVDLKREDTVVVGVVGNVEEVLGAPILEVRR